MIAITFLVPFNKSSILSNVEKKDKEHSTIY